VTKQASDDEAQLEEICARLNSIIERSNGIDKRLSQIERRGKKGKVENLNLTGSSKNQRVTLVQPPSTSKFTATESLVLEDPSFKDDSGTLLEVSSPPTRSPRKSKDVTLRNVYDLVLGLREEVARISQMQEHLNAEIGKLKNVRNPNY
jgi:hypothetical protein